MEFAYNVSTLQGFRKGLENIVILSFMYLHFPTTHS